MKNITTFFSKWPSTGCLDAHLAKSLVHIGLSSINIPSSYQRNTFKRLDLLRAIMLKSVHDLSWSTCQICPSLSYKQLATIFITVCIHFVKLHVIGVLCDLVAGVHCVFPKKS